MRALLPIAALTIAASATLASPADADSRNRAFTAIPATPIFGSSPGFRHDRRGVRGTDTVMIYDREYQGDTAWRPESFNDWWHERPERSYPRWLQSNRNCERKWWAGETLRC